MKLRQIIFRNPVPSSQKHSAPPLLNKPIKMFREIIALHNENHTEPKNERCWKNVEFMNVEIKGTYCHVLWA
jgi:hypothetical protein